jgi:hypothetical protein
MLLISWWLLLLYSAVPMLPCTVCKCWNGCLNYVSACLMLLLQVRAWSSQAGTGLHDELALSSQAGSDDASAISRPLGSTNSGAPAVAAAAAAEAAAAAAGDVDSLWEAMLESDK